ADATMLLEREKDLLRFFEALLHARTEALRIRTHGDLHLGHVLYTGKDFVLVDFNGFEALPVAERRRKRSPLRDLAWMARSFDAAAYELLFDPVRMRETDLEAARPWALHWASWVSASLLQSYLSAAAGAAFLPADREQAATLFDAFVLERSLYQLRACLE